MASTTDEAKETGPLKRVLNAGAGPRQSSGLPACFRTHDWQEIRLDLNPEVLPDVVGTVTDMRAHFGDGTFDAVWSSHNIEHLYDHEVIVALKEFHRILKPNGFVALTCPDLQSVAEMLMDRGLDGKAYDAPIGPIAVHDIVFGHGGSIASGNHFMAHRTGFTQERLGRKATQAGFHEVRVGRGHELDLWAILSMPEFDAHLVNDMVRDSRLAFLFSNEDADP